MSKYTYKTKNGATTGFVPGVGAIVDGVISSNVPLESPNLEPYDKDGNAARVANEQAFAHANEHAKPLDGTASQQNPNQPATAEGGTPTNTGVTQ